jgi:hypothetical protein
MRVEQLGQRGFELVSAPISKADVDGAA